MKRLYHLYKYIRLLKNNKKILADSRINNNPNPLGIQYDWIGRLYTVINLPFFDEKDMDKYAYNYINNTITEINNFLFNLGILEYVKLDTKNIKQIDKFNIRIVLRFRYMDLKKWIIFLMFILIFGIIAFFIFL
ncbi:hypothetical protein M0Q97_06795 [Candidatus Dojkabacteria bacterium]|jgi:hypothetical protein|nr:hypothetical protein [Candidatus Dojkabacteria bacterium]